MTLTTNLDQYKYQNTVIVSMGYDNIETNVTLSTGHGSMLPDPSIIGPYNLFWWNVSDYLNPTDDPFIEVVKCIAKYGDTLIVMRSQQQTLASPKNIPGKLYNMSLIHNTNLDTLSYYNIPQPHGISVHTGTIGTWANIDKTTSSITDITTRSHTLLTDIGTNTHATIDTAILNSTTHISASVAHGVTSNIVGISDTQTLTNKTLTSPFISTIYGSSIANGVITIEGTSNATKTSSYVILQPTSGNVGIGTTSPAYSLVVNSPGANNYNALFFNPAEADGGYSIIWVGKELAYGKAGALSYNLGTAGAGYADSTISLGNYGDAPSLLVKQGGNVGIGTTETSLFNAVGGTTKVAVTGSSGSTDILGNTNASLSIINTDDTANNTAGLHFAWQDTDGKPNFAGASIVAQLGAKVAGQYPSGALAFLTSPVTNAAPTEKVRITAAGNVGIGTTGPVATFQVNKTVTSGAGLVEVARIVGDTSAGISVGDGGALTLFRTPTQVAAKIGYVHGPAGAENYQLVFHTANAGTAAEKMRIDNTGNVGIGTTNPTAKLHIGGTAGVDGIKFPDGTLQTTATASLARAWLSGSDIYHAHDAQVTTQYTTYTKWKTIRLNHLPNGTLRVYFELLGDAPVYPGYARVYRNGAAVGTELSNTSGSVWNSLTENISGWAEGDTLELWAHGTGNAWMDIRNFRILYNKNALLSNS